MIIHPPKARVWTFHDVDELMPWHWSIRMYRDGLMVSDGHWGACARWDDALEIALAMLRKAQAEFWAGIVRDVDLRGWST